MHNSMTLAQMLKCLGRKGRKGVEGHRLPGWQARLRAAAWTAAHGVEGILEHPPPHQQVQ